MRRLAATLILVSTLIAPPIEASAPQTIVVAGGGDGSGALATEVGLRESHAVATGPDGTLYIGESQMRRIRAVDENKLIWTLHGTGNYPEHLHVEPTGDLLFSYYPLGPIPIAGGDGVFRVDAETGTVTTVAGGNSRGSAGDGGPAIDAELCVPRDVVTAPDGRVFIADSCNSRVRVVDVDGMIHTFAGTGTAGFSGDGGPAAQAQLAGPSGLAFRDGTLYIADTFNGRIRMVDETGTISTVVGGGLGSAEPGNLASTAPLGRPTDVEVDEDGTIFINDTQDDRIYRIDARTGLATVIALRSGSQIALAGKGAIYVVRVESAADWHSTVERVDASGVSERVAGNGTCCYGGNHGPATSAELRGPSGLALTPDALPVWSEGGIIAGDQYSYNHVVRRVDATGIIRPVAGTGTYAGIGPFYHLDEGASADAIHLTFPQGVEVDASGDVYVTDPTTGRVIRIVHGRAFTVAGGLGPSDAWTGTTTGSSLGLGRTTPLGRPVGLSFAADGALYITDIGLEDEQPAAVYRLEPTGLIARIAGGGATCGAREEPVPAAGAPLCRPVAVAIDPTGAVFIADPEEGRVLRVDPSTGLLTTLAGDGTCASDGDGGPVSAARICAPSGLAIGPDGDLYIADGGLRFVNGVSVRGDGSIRRVDVVTGEISTVPGITGADVAVGPDGAIFTIHYPPNRLRPTILKLPA